MHMEMNIADKIMPLQPNSSGLTNTTSDQSRQAKELPATLDVSCKRNMTIYKVGQQLQCPYTI